MPKHESRRDGETPQAYQKRRFATKIECKVCAAQTSYVHWKKFAANSRCLGPEVGAKRREEQNKEVPAGLKHRAWMLWQRTKERVDDYNANRKPTDHYLVFQAPLRADGSPDEPDEGLTSKEYQVWSKTRKVFSCAYCAVLESLKLTDKFVPLTRAVCKRPQQGRGGA